VQPATEAATDGQNPENAVYGWLYQDKDSSWGHRHGLLGVTPSGVTPNDPSTGNDECYTQIGAGFAASANRATVRNGYLGPPLDFFYIVELVGEEKGRLATAGNTLGPQPPPMLATATLSPGVPPQLVPLSVSYSPLVFGLNNTIRSAYVYPRNNSQENPQWGQIAAGALGTGGMNCAGTAFPANSVYECYLSVPTTSLVAIAFDAFDQFACVSANPTLPNPNLPGWDSCGVLPPPLVTAISPGSGGAGGGETVTVTGSSFTGATSVQFGASSASAMTVVSDTQITATSPAGQSGPVDVTVVNSSATSPTSAADKFTYN
jgi:IPT/TIG domain